MIRVLQVTYSAARAKQPPKKNMITILDGESLAAHRQV